MTISNKQTRDIDREKSRELFRSMVTSGQNAMRSALLLNGGASIAMLAFIGHLASTENRDSVPIFAPVLLQFAWGAFFITAASVFTYLTQWVHHKYKTCAFWLNVFCMLLGVASLICFLYGLRSAYNAFIFFK